jgi:hypothetical protein
MGRNARAPPGILAPYARTLGASGRWPHNGEIDIMEYCRGTPLANVAWGGPAGPRPMWDIIRKPLESFGNAE